VLNCNDEFSAVFGVKLTGMYEVIFGALLVFNIVNIITELVILLLSVTEMFIE